MLLTDSKLNVTLKTLSAPNAIASPLPIAVVIAVSSVTVSPAAIEETLVPGAIPTPVTKSPTLTFVVEATLITVCPTASAASSVVAKERLEDVSKSKSISAILISCPSGCVRYRYEKSEANTASTPV